MKYTKEQLIQKVKDNDCQYFQEMMYNSWRYNKQSNDQNRVKKIWELNWGDGNEWYVALEFPDENLTVYMEGYYSSEGESEFDKVAFGVPYEFTETRYREATLAEIRDMKIDEILN